MAEDGRSRLLEEAKRRIPSIDQILNEALQVMTGTLISMPFGKALQELDAQATHIYLGYEHEAMRFFAEGWLESRRDRLVAEFEQLHHLLRTEQWHAFKARAATLFSDFAEAVQRLEKDLGNMRKARGGKTFEKAVSHLLSAWGIPHQAPQGNARRELKSIDLVVPDVQTVQANPERSVLLALKRTLRERWKEEVPAAKGKRCWLITLDPVISEGKVDAIIGEGIEQVYAPDEVVQRWRQNAKIQVRSLNALPEDLKQAISG